MFWILEQGASFVNSLACMSFPFYSMLKSSTSAATTILP
jgi:hypothetical protein